MRCVVLSLEPEGAVAVRFTRAHRDCTIAMRVEADGDDYRTKVGVTNASEAAVEQLQSQLKNIYGRVEALDAFHFSYWVPRSKLYEAGYLVLDQMRDQFDGAWAQIHGGIIHMWLPTRDGVDAKAAKRQLEHLLATAGSPAVLGLEAGPPDELLSAIPA